MPAQHVSYAGITLPLATPQLEAIVRELKPFEDFEDADLWNFDQPHQQTGRMPTPSKPDLPPFRLGVLSWPTGASSPAWFHAVVNTDRLNQIRTAVGNPETPAPLVLNDGRVSHEVTASMYLLPARPLNQLGDDFADAWLLTLTDQRFFWYFRRTTVSAKPTSWEDLYSTIAADLGITLAADPIDMAYSSPSGKWVGYYMPSPAVLDAVATSVGQRIVVQLDGTVSAVNWENARDDSDAQVEDPDLRVLMGGRVSAADVRRYVPASINVLFLDTTAADTTVPHVENRTLVSLSVDGYGAATGISGNAEIIYADLAYDGTNGTAVASYAAAAATDWYGWRLENVDVSLPGIQNWTPTGWEDCVEWTVQLRNRTFWEVESGSEGDGIPDPFASTKVRRGPWSDVPSGYFPSGNDVGPPPQPGGCDGTGDAWVAGLLDTACLKLTVPDARGFCAGIDKDQLLYLRNTAANVWTSQSWDCSGTPPTGWVDANFVCDPSSVSGPAVFTSKTTGSSEPLLTLCGISYSLTIVCGGTDTVVFSGGGREYCSGTAHVPPCDDNFLVKLECTCCSIDGWQGDGYYCVCVSGGTDCSTCDLAPVLLTDANGDRCDPDITICSCRFDTFEEAEAACSPPVVPDAECNGLPVTVSQLLYLHFSACTGDFASLNGITLGPMTWNGSGSWVNSGTQSGFTTFRVDLNPGPPWEICSTGVTLAGCIDDTTGLSCIQCSPWALENGFTPAAGTCLSSGGTAHYIVDESPT